MMKNNNIILSYNGSEKVYSEILFQKYIKHIIKINGIYFPFTTYPTNQITISNVAHVNIFHIKILKMPFSSWRALIRILPEIIMHNNFPTKLKEEYKDIKDICKIGIL